MILADKIIKHRRQKGWSQEELAEKMGVSRQAVSKWESAQATPDIEKILLLSELFGVSTDYLLKESIEDADAADETADAPTQSRPAPRRVTKDEAAEYIEERRRASWQIALATFLCILSPITLILLGGASDTGAITFSDSAIAALGLCALFAFVIAALPFYIRCGIRHEQYKFLEDSTAFELDIPASEMLRERLNAFRGAYTAYNITATCLCVFSPVPLIVGAFAEKERLVAAMLCVTIAIAGVGVFLFILAGVRQASMQRLLSEGEFEPKENEENGLVKAVSAAYWPLLTAAFLCWGFIGNAWHICWLIFAIGGALYAPLIAVMRLITKKKK